MPSSVPFELFCMHRQMFLLVRDALLMYLGSLSTMPKWSSPHENHLPLDQSFNFIDQISFRFFFRHALIC